MGEDKTIRATLKNDTNIMNNANDNAKTTKAPQSEPAISEKILSGLIEDRETVKGFWKQAMSYIGFAAGLGGGYLLFGMGKDKEIKQLQDQVKLLETRVQHFKDKAKKIKKRYQTPEYGPINGRVTPNRKATPNGRANGLVNMD